MKINYRDCEIECYKDKSITGYGMMFYSIFTNSGIEITSGFSIDESNIRVYTLALKEIVDDYYENPSEYE